jgi:hypothetical protein
MQARQEQAAVNSHGSDCGHAVHAIRGHPSKVSSILPPSKILDRVTGHDVLLYLPEMVLSMRIYAVVAIATRLTNRRA